METLTNVLFTNVNETETSTNGVLKCGRNGIVDKCQTYNVDESETSTNGILTM